MNTQKENNSIRELKIKRWSTGQKFIKRERYLANGNANVRAKNK
jgi:hypothetical protein